MSMIYDLTRLSSKGQVVIPRTIRSTLGLHTGMRLAMFTDGEHILLKPIPAPDVSAFREMAEEARKVAKKAKAKRKDTEP